MSEIDRLQVFGARCSGTNRVHGLADKSFPGVEVLTTHHAEGYSNFGWKHRSLGSRSRVYVDGDWIQEEGKGNYRYFDDNRIDSHEIPMHDARYAGVDSDGDPYIQSNPLPLEEASDTLFVVVYRNPVTMLRSLHTQPHHALKLFDRRDSEGLSFPQFIQEEWRTYECPPHMEDKKKHGQRGKWIEKGAIIEDQDSIFVHRSESITLFEAFPEYVPHVVFVHHEAVNRDPRGFVEQIADVYDLSLAPTIADVKTYKGHQNTGHSTPTEYEPLDQETLYVVLEKIDWEAETKVGYEPRDRRSVFTADEIERPGELLVVETQKDPRFYRGGELVSFL